jgi:uncharacterized membrane protein
MLFGVDIPGLGIALALVAVLITGVFATNLLGRKLVIYGENIISHIPLVRAIYQSTKQVTETLFSGTGNYFRKVLLVPYPNANTWTLAFLTNSELGEVQEKKTDQKCVGVFIPTAPNPITGYFLIFPKEDVIELKMTVEEAFKMIISFGMVVPTQPSQSGKSVPPSAGDFWPEDDGRAQ